MMKISKAEQQTKSGFSQPRGEWRKRDESSGYGARSCPPPGIPKARIPATAPTLQITPGGHNAPSTRVREQEEHILDRGRTATLSILRPLFACVNDSVMETLRTNCSCDEYQALLNRIRAIFETSKCADVAGTVRTVFRANSEAYTILLAKLAAAEAPPGSSAASAIIGWVGRQRWRLIRPTPQPNEGIYQAGAVGAFTTCLGHRIHVVGPLTQDRLQRACASWGEHGPELLRFFHGTDFLSAMEMVQYGVALSRSAPYADFGAGFYLTPDFELACKYARWQSDGESAAVLAYDVPRRWVDDALHLSGNDWHETVTACHRGQASYMLRDQSLVYGKITRNPNEVVCGLTPRESSAYQLCVRSEKMAMELGHMLVGAVYSDVSL